MSAQTVHRVLATATVANELNAWIDGKYQTPGTELPCIESNDPVRASVELRETWGLREAPIKNMQHLLERYGIRVYSIPSVDRTVDAFSYWTDQRAVIFLNTTKSAERLRFDLAHELGHLILHKNSEYDRSKLKEKQADQFAGSFLVPSVALQRQVVGDVQLKDVLSLKRHWRVSALAMVEQLWHLRLISEWSRRQWIIELGRQGYRTDEPDGHQREVSKLLVQLMKLAVADGFTYKKIAAELNLQDRDIEELFFGLGMLPLRGEGSTRISSRSSRAALRRVQ